MELLATVQRAAAMDSEVSDAIDRLFTYEPWNPTQIVCGENVRNALADAVRAIVDYVPAGPTRSRAISAIIDARMLANMAITFRGKV